MRITNPARKGVPIRRGGPGSDDPSRFSWPFVTLKMALAEAYSLMPDHISGPTLLETERYDLAATMPPGTTKEQFHLMLQNLLIERFHLAVRHVPKEIPLYELTVSKNGPKLKPHVRVEGEEADRDKYLGKRFPSLDADFDGFPILVPGIRTSGKMKDGLIRETYSGYTMAEFAYALELPGRPLEIPGFETDKMVRDETSLNGSYDFHLMFAAWLQRPQVVAPDAAGAASGLARPHRWRFSFQRA